MRSLSVILEATTDDGDMLDIFYRPSAAPKTFSRKFAQNTHSQGALGQAPRLCKGRGGEHYRWLTHPANIIQECDVKHLEEEIIMNTQAAISRYTEIKSQTLSHEGIGYNVISTALNKLEVNLKSLVSSTHTQERTKAFETSLLTLYFLQSSLDFKVQGNLAINLYRLYEFCRITLLEIGINGSSNNNEINKCHSYINEIRLSWDSVRDK